MTHPTDPSDAPSRTGRFWAWLPVGVFLVQGAVLAATIVLSTRSGVDAVEPDYYARSLAWDEHAELLRAADRLGWTLHLTVSEPKGPRTDRDLIVSITDRDARPVDGARVSAETFHHADAGERASADLFPDAAVRTHAATFPMRRPGLWEVRLTVVRGPERCVFVRQVELEE